MPRGPSRRGGPNPDEHSRPPATADEVAVAAAEVINAVAVAASGESSLEQILKASFDSLGRVVPMTGGSFAMVEGDELVIHAAVGPFAAEARGQRVPRSGGRSWRVIETGEPFMSNDVKAEGLRRTTPIRSYIAVPLAWRGAVFGLLEVDSTEANAFSKWHLQLMLRVAAVLSGPVQLARRMEADAQARSVTDEARRRLALVAEASRVLASSLDYESTLTNVAHLIVPGFADWCIIDVLHENGSLRQIVQVHADPARERVARELRRRYPPSSEGPIPHPIYRVIQHDESLLDEAVADENLAARALDADHLAMLRAMDIRSHLIVPLSLRGRVLGAMSFVRDSSTPRFTHEDVALAEEIGHRAARAVDTAYLYAAEQRARAEAEEAARRVNVTNSLIALAASANDLGGVFEEFGEILRTLIPLVRVTVSLHVPERDALTMPYFKGPELTAPPERLEGPKAGTARGWVIDHDHPHIRTDTRLANEFSEDIVLGEAGIRSYLVVPMRVGGRVIGTLNFGDEKPGQYTETHARLAQPIADQLALTISRLQLFEQVERRAGELSETLQRALLPAALPEPAFSAIGALYLPADPQAGIGGDWYDAVTLPDDTVFLSVGDVAGHGVQAAAAMGQVRNIARAYALEGRTPAEIVNRLNRLLCRMPDGPQLSLWVATLDPYTGVYTYCGGGHPPVLVMQPGDPLATVTCAGPPVGLLIAFEYPEDRLTLKRGSRLVSITDGLIEATRDIAASERVLADTAVRTRADPPARAAASIVRQVLGTNLHEDDVAVLVFDLLPTEAPLSFSVPASPESLYRVRRAVRLFAQHAGLPGERTEEIVFAVGEAALNTVEHAYRGTGGQLQVQGEHRNGTLIITVRDLGQWRDPVDRGRGRGMKIMREFADNVELHTGPEGTMVKMEWQLVSTPR